MSDLHKTALIDQLLQVPLNRRDIRWQIEFSTHLPAASFQCGNPQIITGPDGFPYFQLLLPLPGVSFESFSILKMMDDFLLSEGLGVVLNADKSQPDWVLSYGDIVNLKLKGSLLSPEKHPFATQNKMGTETLGKGSTIVAGKLAADLYPSTVSGPLRKMLQHNGVRDPKVALMVLHPEKQSGFELAFNITPQNFSSEEHYLSVFQAIGWFLPKHYAYLGTSEAGATGFVRL
ncbi:MAG: hypothetical protein K0R24_1210 [Gammaproteobacteria bacterium]|jgi:hypothetical protein|nr:hypothetical protein [Gammaproteobacteria bacterium]